MRVVIADDELLLREGLARLLAEVGFEVVGKAANPVELARAVDRARPDIVIVDIRMPPTHTDEGLVAARELAKTHPDIGVLVLSHHLDSRFAGQLLEEHPDRVGYLLKERLSDIAVLTDALHRIADGESVIDATIVSHLLRRRRDPDPLGELTEREREVLGLMAEGRSNHAIAARLVVGDKTIEAHVHNVFMKLELEEAPDDHRRVLAVLAYLRGTTGRRSAAQDN
jgi:DNA-binding NarL/FixJ family response regulator